MLLVGDIGGTKTELAIFNSVTALDMPLANDIFTSKKYASLEEIVHEFLGKHTIEIEEIDRAAFGVAGPVLNDKAAITNLPWVVEADKLKREYSLKSVLLLNDLEAIASAVPFLRASDLVTLNPGQLATNGSLAVIAPGTGLGEAFLTWNGQSYTAHRSEGGHADFGPLNELQVDLLRYLQPRYKHVSYEWVCSGKGLPNIYAFLRDSKYAPEPAWLAEKIAQADDPNKVITIASLDKTAPDPLCVATMRMFVAILAAEAGNLGLKILSEGGLFIGGGIPQRILPFLQEEAFLRVFFDKGRLKEVLESMPVHVILNTKVALQGAAYRGFALERHDR